MKRSNTPQICSLVSCSWFYYVSKCFVSWNYLNGLDAPVVRRIPDPSQKPCSHSPAPSKLSTTKSNTESMPTLSIPSMTIWLIKKLVDFQVRRYQSILNYRESNQILLENTVSWRHFSRALFLFHDSMGISVVSLVQQLAWVKSNWRSVFSCLTLFGVSSWQQQQQ